MKFHEDNLQMACVQLFDWKYPDLRGLLIHIPNGGKRNVREAAKFKKMGVRAGVPDLFLAWPSHGLNGLWMELKAGKNKLTEHQKAFFVRLVAAGYRVIVIRSVEEFEGCIQEYLK